MSVRDASAPTGTDRGARVARGVAAASFATVVAAFSHAAAGSSAPGAVGVLISYAFAVLICTALASRRLTVPRLVVSVLTSQALFHILFGVGAGDPPTDWSQHLGHHGEVVGTLPLGEVVSTGHVGHDGAWMWVAHAVAAVVTIAAVLWGVRVGRALVSVLEAGIRLVLARTAGIVLVESGSRRVAEAVAVPEWVPHARLMLSPMRHRGPPLLSLPASALV